MRLLLCLAIALFPLGVAADRGKITLKPQVQVFEPDQKAIIGYNGKREVLILSTDLKASEETMAIEILPLPSEPKVSKGDVKSYTEVQKLINKHWNSRWKLGDSKNDRSGGQNAAVEFLFNEKLGAHDLTVIKALDAKALYDWLESFFKEKGSKQTVFPHIRGILSSYVEKKCNYFVIDVINLTDKQNSRDPIIYEFDSECLYYPLPISSMGRGVGGVSLMVFSDSSYLGVHHPINYMAGQSSTPLHQGVYSYEGLQNSPLLAHFGVTLDETNTVSDALTPLFTNAEKVYFTYWRWQMPLSAMLCDVKLQRIKQWERFSYVPYDARDDMKILFENLSRENAGGALLDAAINLTSPHQSEMLLKVVKCLRACPDKKAAIENVKASSSLPDDVKHDVILLIEQGKNDEVLAQCVAGLRKFVK